MGALNFNYIGFKIYNNLKKALYNNLKQKFERIKSVHIYYFTMAELGGREPSSKIIIVYILWDTNETNGTALKWKS